MLFSNSYTSVTVFNEVPIVKIRGHALLIVQPLSPPLNNLESYPAIILYVALVFHPKNAVILVPV